MTALNPIAPSPSSVDDPRWQAVLTRNPSADGTFVYAVKTTGVYCRPSCASRTAKVQNVSFFVSTRAAEQAGYRPCKRCRPDQVSVHQLRAKAIAEACRTIEASDSAPSLTSLAKAAGMSAYHFHRVFKGATGLTPRQYAAAHREHRVRLQLKSAASITDAIFEAGYSSNSRFYERADSALGMTPSEYRDGGANTTIRFAVGECSLGSILVAQSERGICAISLGENPQELARDLQDRFPRARFIGGDAQFEQLVANVVGFVERPMGNFDLPLDIRGTAFQRRVWQALREIKPGSTLSYTQLAERIGMPKAVRAVAQACGANTLAVAIPCHRVVRTDGALSGYRWGVERKRALLDREQDTQPSMI
jgi:AraC family transcriptional regulator of adaptative response/methylated-DNA-[protein]-cysteine methyltransferase